MVRRSCSILLAVWALVLLPTLCAGGLIAHACDCAPDAVCQHEAGCDVDPCSELSAATVKRSDQSEVALIHSVAEFSLPTSTYEGDPLREALHAWRPTGERFHLPFAPSDVHLLI